MLLAVVCISAFIACILSRGQLFSINLEIERERKEILKRRKILICDDIRENVYGLRPEHLREGIYDI